MEFEKLRMGGYAAALGVLGGGWVAQLVAEGLILSWDLFLPHFLRYFRSKAWAVGFAAAVVQGPSQLMGPVSAWLTERWGARWVVMGCGVLGTAGLGLASQCRSVWQLVAASALLGAAIGLSSVPIVTATSFHFSGRYRNALTALATTGGALGAVLFPFLIQALLETSPWQYALMIIGCVFLQLVVCGALLPGLPRSSSSLSKERRAGTLDSLKPDVLGSIADMVERQERERRRSQTEEEAGRPAGERRSALHAFLWACFAWALGCYMFDMLPIRLTEEGFTGRQIAVLMTLQACGYFPGRVAAAGVVWWARVDVTGVFSLTLAVQGGAVLGSAVEGQTFGTYAAWVLLIGFGYGMTTALVPSVVLALVGLEELNHAFGLQLFVEGIAGCVGAPAAGLLSSTRWGPFNAAYATAGLIGLSAPLFLAPFHWPLASALRRSKKTKSLSLPLSSGDSVTHPL